MRRNDEAHIMYLMQTGRAEQAARTFFNLRVFHDLASSRKQALYLITDDDAWVNRAQSRQARRQLVVGLHQLNDIRMGIYEGILQGNVTADELSDMLRSAYEWRRFMNRNARAIGAENEVLQSELQERQRVREINETQILEQDVNEPQD